MLYDVLFRLLCVAPYLKKPAFLNVQAGGSFMKPTEIAHLKMGKLQATNWAGKSAALRVLQGQSVWLKYKDKNYMDYGAAFKMGQ